MKYFLIGICSFIILSCRNEKKRLPENIVLNDTVKQEPSASTANRKYSGLFVVGKNMRSFRNCENPDRDYFVMDSTGQMDELYKTIFTNSPAFPYEYVYVEVKGHVSAAPPQLATRGFDSTITIDEILTFEQKNYRNTCIPYDFWALGNEPNWSLQVSQKEGIIALKDYSNNSVYLFEYFSPKVVNDEVYTYNSNNYANQTSINIVIKKQQCSDGMSENQDQYSVSVLINGRRYNGCAIRGGEEP